jgi:hypothetical protein
MDQSSNTPLDRNTALGAPKPIDNTLENAARAVFDFRAGNAATDHEWAHARARLIEFATILRSWQLDADSSHSGTSQPKAA